MKTMRNMAVAGLVMAVCGSLALGADVAVNWVTTNSGNWSDISSAGSTGWNVATYPNTGTADDYRWAQPGTGATPVTITIDVPDAEIGRMLMSGFAEGHWVIDSSDPVNNKLNVTSWVDLRQIGLTYVNQTLTIDAPVVMLAGNHGIAGGWSTASARVQFNAEISGPGDIYWNNIGGNTAYTGDIAFNAANTFTGKTYWQGSTLGTGDLYLNDTHALQNSTLSMAITDETYGRVQFSAPGSTFVLGGLEGVRPLNMDGKTIQIGNNDSSTVYDGLLSNGTVEKIGTGVLTLGGANSYGGNTTVSNGTLALGAGGSIATSPVITVASGATFDVSAVSGGFSLVTGQTLTGSGTVVGAVTASSGASLAPGDSPGILTTGDLALSTGSVVSMDIWGTATPGTDYDQLVGGAGSTLDLETDWILELSVVSATPINADLQLFDYDAYTGGGMPDIRFVAGGATDWSFDPGTGFLTLTNYIPEPSALTLLGLALAGLLGRCHTRAS